MDTDVDHLGAQACIQTFIRLWPKVKTDDGTFRDPGPMCTGNIQIKCCSNLLTYIIHCNVWWAGSRQVKIGLLLSCAVAATPQQLGGHVWVLRAGTTGEFPGQAYQV